VPITLPSGGPRIRPSDGVLREPGAFPSGMPRPYGSAGPHGGGFPGGGFGKPAGVDDAIWQKAQAACASVRPGGRPGGRAGNRGNGMDAAYANCLRQHAVTLAGSAPSTGDPAVKKALDTCQVLKRTASATPSS
jgi:hypothetical protein